MGLAELRKALEKAVARLDPDVVEGATAAGAVQEFARIEKLAAAGKALCARRVADSGAWRRHGDRSPADWLARTTQSSIGQADRLLETAERLKELPATAKAFRAGRLSDRLTYYRNDKTPSSGNDPHAFLADPRLFGNSGAEAELAAFLQSYGRNVIDPDGPGPIFEVPIADPGNLWCLHYPEPQTGSRAYPPPASGTCGPVRH